MAARILLSEKHSELVAPLDVLTERVLQHVDEDDVRDSAVKAARTVASLLLIHGGAAAREALGIPPPDPVRQEYWRNQNSPGSAEIAEGLNSVQLEISDKAACCAGGRGYWVSASLWLPAEDANLPSDFGTPKSVADST